METSTKRLFLLDAYALIYRAHFAFTKSPRINSKGHNTSVAFGFTNTLLEVLQKQKPTHIGVVFDTSAPTFRDEIYKEYKATRQETPEDIRYGIPKVKDIISGFNIPIIEKDGYEADDLIGTLAKKAVNMGFEVYMMTPDKDFGQLVEDKILLYKPAYMGNSVDVLGVKEVCEKWDIAHVGQVIDMLGLQGDTSDNIPGIPGVGPKTASTLLKKYGTIESIIQHSAELKGKQKELVETYGEQALLSKKLATIITDAPIEFNPSELQCGEPNADVLKPIFHEMEFKTIASRVFGGSSNDLPIVKSNSQLSMFDNAPSSVGNEDVSGNKNFSSEVLVYHVADTPALQNDLISKLSEQSAIAIEVSAEGLSDSEALIYALAFSFKAGEAYYVPISSEASQHILQSFKTIFENENIEKVGHNLKASLLALKINGFELKGKLFDSLLAHYLIEPESSHDLNILCNQYLDYTLLSGSEKNVGNRISEQVDQTFQLRPKLQKALEERHHGKLMKEVEMPLLSVLAAMEYEGVKVDTEKLAVMSEDLKLESEKVQQKIYELAGTSFNIASPKQLGEILFEQLKLIDKPKKTKSGQYATGEEVLVGLAAENEIARHILDFREYEKLRSTYVDALPKMISKRDGRIHTDYRQALAVTGRLSSNNPNLQNIPIRTEKGRAIRGAFVARDNEHLFMSADYSQIELRIAASFAKDSTMIEAFKKGRDIHTTTAAKVFNVPLDKVDQNMRRKAKEVNFGILYGSTAFGLAQNLGISRSEASEIIKSYFSEFPSIKRYMDEAINKAREFQFVETILGRRRYLRDINSRNITTRGFAERNAINAPIQGSAADIIKIAMVNIHQWMLDKKLKSRMIMQVHDELVFDVHIDEVDIMKTEVPELMKSAVHLDVPMEVEAGIGKNWLEAH